METRQAEVTENGGLVGSGQAQTCRSIVMGRGKAKAGAACSSHELLFTPQPPCLAQNRKSEVGPESGRNEMHKRPN